MNGVETQIGGLLLPAYLVQLIKDGRWKAPKDRHLLRAIFNDEPYDPRFYDLAGIVRESRSFQEWSQDDLAHYLHVGNRGLGITPSLAVLIGDLGTDSPIALDYRLSSSSPRVIHLRPDGWCEVAPDIETLARQLGM